MPQKVADATPRVGVLSNWATAHPEFSVSIKKGPENLAKPCVAAVPVCRCGAYFSRAFVGSSRSAACVARTSQALNPELG